MPDGQPPGITSLGAAGWVVDGLGVALVVVPTCPALGPVTAFFADPHAVRTGSNKRTAKSWSLQRLPIRPQISMP
jgi:hypothetical protein